MDREEFRDKFAVDETTGAWVYKSDYVDPETGWRRGKTRRNEEMTVKEDRRSKTIRGGNWDDQCGWMGEKEYERMVDSCVAVCCGTCRYEQVCDQKNGVCDRWKRRIRRGHGD